MLSRQASRIVEAFRSVDFPAEAAQEIASALCDVDQEIEHHGPVTIRRDLPREDRQFSPRTGDENLHPVPPMRAPRITGACLTLSNPPIGDSDRRGENGFTLDLPNGVMRNRGETWVRKWAKLTAHTTVMDAESTRINTSSAYVNAYYYAGDGVECGDSKGRDESDTQIRIFYANEDNRPPVGSVVSYLRDQDGLAWGDISGGAAASPLRWAKATTGWEWHDEQAHLGYVVAQEAEDHHGNNLSSTTTRIYLAGSPKADPNVQKNWVIGWRYDIHGEPAAVCDHLDAPIGRVAMQDNLTVPGGWAAYTTMASYSPVGYDSGNSDYDAIGKQVGNHPIRPTEHSSDEPSSGTSTWGAAGWYDTGWCLDDHAETDTFTSQTGITVLVTSPPTSESQAGITVQTTSPPTSASQTGITVQVTSPPTSASQAGITVNAPSPSESSLTLDSLQVVAAGGDTGTAALTIGSQALATNSAVAPISVTGNLDVAAFTVAADTSKIVIGIGTHVPHTHAALETTWTFDALGGHELNPDNGLDIETEPPSGTSDTHTHILDGTSTQCWYSYEGNDHTTTESHTLTHVIAQNAHDHNIAVGTQAISTANLIVTDAGHTHHVGGHAHTVSPDPHSHSLGAHTHSLTGLTYQVDLQHSHSATAQAHTHTVAHSHSTLDEAHTHTVTHSHSVTDQAHTHTVTHSHSTDDPSHAHTTPVLTHTGTLYHREEDFRPPLNTILFIRRVGPADD
jgi:hypothetical protein